MAHNTVIGVFESDRAAQDVAEQLKNQGIPETQIRVSSSEQENEHHRGFIQWLEDLFSNGPKEDASDIRGAIHQGRSVVAVDTDEAQLEQAAQVMERCGAMEITESGNETGIETAAQGLESNGGQQHSIPVVEQQLDVQKKTVLQGGVRVYSHVSEQPVEEQVRLRQEKVRSSAH